MSLMDKVSQYDSQWGETSHRMPEEKISLTSNTGFDNKFI